MYGVTIEAGNCIYCGRHIDDSGNVFLCKECRRKEEEIKCRHERPKVVGTGTVIPGKPTTAKELRQKLIDKEEQ